MKSKAARKFFEERKGDVYKEAKKNSSYAFEFLNANALETGVYYFYLLPKHPEKCPEGEYYIHEAGIPDPKKPEDFRLKKRIMLGDATGQPCYLQDMEAALNKNNRFKKLPDVIRKKLAPALSGFKKLQYPTAFLIDIKTKEIPKPTEDDPGAVVTRKEFVSNPEKKEEQGIILTVWQKTIVEDIESILEEHPEVRDPDEGKLLKLKVNKKSKKYRVSLAKKREFIRKELYTKLYPDIGKFSESLIYDYESVKIMFFERMGKSVIKALMDAGINVNNPSKPPKSKSKDIEEEYEEEDDEDEEDDESEEEDEDDEDEDDEDVFDEDFDEDDDDFDDEDF